MAWRLVTGAGTVTSADIRSLRQAVNAAEGFRRRPALTTAKFAGHAFGGCILYLGCLTLQPWAAAALTPVCAIVLIVAVMIGHEATHGSAYTSKRANLLVRNLAFPLLSGMSGLYWHYKHDVLHHRNPNVVGWDQDLEVIPLALGRSYHIGSSAFCRWVQRRLQRGWMFWVLSPLLPLDLRLRSIRYLCSHANARGVGGACVTDGAMMLSHLLVFVVGPIWVFGAERALLVYLTVWGVAGVWLTMVGLVGHSACPLFDRADDRWALQFHTTRNLQLGPILSWCFVGLDFQIEHHLFPQISHFRLRRVAPIVQAFALEHGLPYRQSSLLGCLRLITAYFDSAWDDEVLSLSAGVLQPGEGRPAYPMWGRLRSDFN
jgi:fatty acid desaturase